ncbi:MAG: hypothetical protein A2151_04615 [Candidatus Muproteobacteria bacterium RBG_16_65_34]|uniref:Uncharacterized protein n=1 Tax=Candidatus Muproteobacteria bacterium RBG_16_65_34 TaxID=1817760 RepID=A0A1F6TPE3_9PROT|nr:MAG: hypothetical protein A2151_04615 [Candidatus Muproteobacteria bacterium RBG_16_65_34]
MAWHQAEIAGIGAVIPIIAKHQKMVGGNNERAEVIPRRKARHPLDSVLFPIRSLAHAKRIYLGAVPERFLYGILRNVLGLLPINDNQFVPHLHRISGKSDNSFDESRAVTWRGKCNDVAPSGLTDTRDDQIG